MYIIAYWFLIAVLVFYEVLRFKKSKVDFLTIFNFYFLISYLLPCAIWVSMPEVFEKAVPYHLFYNAAETVEVLLAVSIGYAGFLYFYRLFYYVRPPFYFIALPVGGGEALARKMVFVMLAFCILVFLAIGIVGGVADFIAAGIEARHNSSGFGVAGYFRYFYSAFPLIFIALITMGLGARAGLWGKKSRLTFVFVFTVGLLALISNGGRGALIGAAVNVFMYLYMVGRLRITFSMLLLLVPVLFSLLFIVLELHSISNALIRGEDVTLLERLKNFPVRVLDSIVAVFSYYAHYLYIVVEMWEKSDVYNYPRLGSDNVSAFILLLPGVDSNAFGFFDLPDVVSQEVMGKTAGSIPPGWIGWTLLNGGYFWLVVKVAYSAMVAVMIDKSRDKILDSAGIVVGNFVYFLCVLVVYNLLFMGTASNLIRGSLGALTFFALMCFVPYFRVVRIALAKTA